MRTGRLDDTDPDRLLAELRTIAAGRIGTLTDREREVLSLAGCGMSNAAIARYLVLSPATVKTHVNRVMKKLAVHDRPQLVALAHVSGILAVGRADH